MGRAGGGGGGRSSGGGHSSGRSGGGHSVGRSSGGSRAGSGSRSGGGSFGGGLGAPRGGGPRGPVGGPMGGPGPRGPIGGPGPRGPIGGPGRGFRRRRSGGCLSTIFVVVFILLVLMILFPAMLTGSSVRLTNSGSSSSSGSQTSTIARTKLDTDNAYINDCVIDELGWFDNVSKTESELKDFWEETGVQPYIILRDYDASLGTDSAKEQWALDYYDENFDTENIFLYVYFAEQDTDNDVGYMAYASGKQTSSVMDSEAVEIFWNNIDKYWYTDLSTDDVFINAFNDTADTIMHVSTTGKDIMKWALIVAAVVIVGVVAVTLVKQKNQRAKEKAEEDQRILNTPVNDLAKDDLEDKYL